MKLESHVRIALNTLNTIEKHLKWKIYKPVYIIGSIAPDLNILFPKHTIRMTIKRWKRRLVRVDKTSSNIVKSFTLGVITHYICDYFCLVHNIQSHGPRHKIYERYLNNYLKKQIDFIGLDDENINMQWDILIKQLEEEVLNNKVDIEATPMAIKSQKDKLNSIADKLITMNKTYIENVNTKISKGWYTDIDRISMDIKYATFMCRKIALELVG